MEQYIKEKEFALGVAGLATGFGIAEDIEKKESATTVVVNAIVNSIFYGGLAYVAAKWFNEDNIKISKIKK